MEMKMRKILGTPDLSEVDIAGLTRVKNNLR